MNSSLSSKEITVTKYPPDIRTNLFKRNSSLPTVDNAYSFTRDRNALALLITSIESLSLHRIGITYLIMVKVVYANYFDLKIVFFIYNENMLSYPSIES